MPTPQQCLDVMADALVAKGMLGDVPAIKEVGDRLDGRAIQAIEQTSDVTHRYVAELPALSKTGDEWQRDHASKLEARTIQ